LGKQSKENAGRKCLLLDLDETLVHSSFQPVANADLLVPITVQGSTFGYSPTTHPIYVMKRPGVDAFLSAVCDLFEVVIFTASLASYADPVIDFLDPKGRLSGRLYRDSCVLLQGMYIKDMSRIGRHMDNLVLIDNSPTSYALQPDNALPCLSWFSDREDRELLDRLLPLLVKLHALESVSTWRQQHLSDICLAAT
jgi:RNA polymerase II subunit A small phosphatase-like protein